MLFKKPDLRILLTIVFAFLFSLSFYAQRQIVNINSNWHFFKGDISKITQEKSLVWEEVNLPHTWNAQDVLDDVPGYHRGVCWYKKQLFVGETYKNKSIFLQFEGVNEVAHIYVNKKELGFHEGGYTGFTFDITDAIKIGEKNLIEVKVNNTHDETILPIHGDLCHFGGIYRDVRLISTENVHFDMEYYGSDGVFVKPKLDKSKNGSLEIHGRITNNSRINEKAFIKVKLLHKAQGLVKEHQMDIAIEAPQQTFKLILGNIEKPMLWSDKDPNLYQLEISLCSEQKFWDKLSIPIGFRNYYLDKEKGFFLNGEPCKIKGMGYSQDYDKMGYAMPDDLIVNDVRLMKEMGVNFLYSLYPVDQAFLAECDKQGVLGWIRLPILSKISHLPEFKTKSVKMLKEMVYQNYNHPSMVIFGLACEQLGAMDWFWPDPIDPDSAKVHMDYTYEFFKELRGMIDEMDPERLKGDDFHTDPTPYFYKQSGLTDIYDFNCWGLYQGWYHNNLDSVSGFIDRMWNYNRDIPMMVVYGAGNDERIHTYKPNQFDYSCEYQQEYHLHYNKVFASKNWVGQFVWLFNDFQREGRGDAVPHINQKGMVNAAREKKDIFYYFQSVWTETPMVYIAAKDWNRRIELESASTVPIKAFSNMDEVELFCNGKSYGVKKPDFGETVWEVKLESGENKIEAIAKKDGQELKDNTQIEIISLENELQNEVLPDNSLCINVGNSHTFFDDPIMKNYWLHDRQYSEGLYGHRNGRYHTVWNSMPAWQGIREGIAAKIKGTENDPLFQTFLIGITEYQLDMPAGDYKVELLFVEPFSDVARLKSEEKTGADENGERIFSVKINGQLICENMNLAADIGVQRAHVISAEVYADKNVLIELIPVKGEPVLCGVKLDVLK